MDNLYQKEEPNNQFNQRFNTAAIIVASKERDSTQNQVIPSITNTLEVFELYDARQKIFS